VWQPCQSARRHTIAARAIPPCSIYSLAESKVHQAQGNFAAATADLERGVKIAADFADAWHRLAILYRGLGRGEAVTKTKAGIDGKQVAENE